MLGGSGRPGRVRPWWWWGSLFLKMPARLPVDIPQVSCQSYSSHGGGGPPVSPMPQQAATLVGFGKHERSADDANNPAALFFEEIPETRKKPTWQFTEFPAGTDLYERRGVSCFNLGEIQTWATALEAFERKHKEHYQNLLLLRVMISGQSRFSSFRFPLIVLSLILSRGSFFAN